MSDKLKDRLFINGKDAWEEYGVTMGSGFISALEAPLPMKDYIEGESRLEHGKTVITEGARVDSRDVTLGFNIHGSTEDTFLANRDAFYEVLQDGSVTFSIRFMSGRESANYRLVYKRGVSFSQGRTHRSCTLTAKFEEPNPKNRE